MHRTGCMLRCTLANNFNPVPWKMITHQIIWFSFGLLATLTDPPRHEPRRPLSTGHRTYRVARRKAWTKSDNWDEVSSSYRVINSANRCATQFRPRSPTKPDPHNRDNFVSLLTCFSTMRSFITKLTVSTQNNFFVQRIFCMESAYLNFNFRTVKNSGKKEFLN